VKDRSAGLAAIAETQAAKGSAGPGGAGRQKERAAELKTTRRGGKTDGNSDVLTQIAEMPEPDRLIAERTHEIVRAAAPGVAPRTWYGTGEGCGQEQRGIEFVGGGADERPDLLGEEDLKIA
jgi:hypothetical protein